MAVHYLTLLDIEVYFKKEISKKELKAQSIGTTITLNGDQITIIASQKHSKLTTEAV